MDSVQEHRSKAIKKIRFGLVIVSSSRSAGRGEDYTGKVIEELIVKNGHDLIFKKIIPDERDKILESLDEARKSGVQSLIYSGGTGISRRDQTPDTLMEKFEKRLEGFGEIFRFLSYEQIGAAAFLSRATAGIYGGMLVYSIPGSPGAAKLAMEKLILPETGHALREVYKE